MAVRPRLRPPLAFALVLLLTPALAGCLIAREDVDLDAAFGPEHVSDGYYLHDVVQYRIAGEETWSTISAPLELLFEAEPVVVEKPDEPSPARPGGVEVVLPSLALPRYEFRLDVEDGSALANTSIRWTMDPQFGPIAQEMLDFDDAFRFQPTTFGPHHLRFVIEDARGITYGELDTPTRLTLTGIWTAHSTIHPVRIDGAPEPPGYDEMRDRFLLESNSTILDLRTSFRGTHDPLRHGSDVDLGILVADGRALCTGGGGAEPGRAPASAYEQFVTEVGAGEHVVLVGAMPSQCGNWFYENTGPVPYTVTIRAGIEPTSP